MNESLNNELINNEPSKFESEKKLLPEGFAEKFPLISNKLNDDVKVAAFLEFSEEFAENNETCAEVIEEILKMHESQGMDVVTLHVDSGGGHSRNAGYVYQVLASYTQWSARQIKNIVFPFFNTIECIW